MKPVPGRTNVIALRAGVGSVRGIGKEIGSFSVVSMPVPWEIAKRHIDGRPEAVVLIDSVERDLLDAQLDALPHCDTILGIGGGQAIDAAKYMAWRRGLRLVSVPTILSVNAFVTPAAGVRVKHDVHYVGEASPDPLIIDYDLIRTAPAELNIAGIGDLLSIHTASFDWELAHRSGRSEYPFSPEAVRAARSILDALYGVLPGIRSVSTAGMDAIVEGYMALNAICLPIGHFRVEEGSEHYLFYELEERCKRPFIHGNIIGLGIYLMSRLQHNDPGSITRVMKEAGLSFQPFHLALTRDTLEASLSNLRSFVQSRERLWYTVIDEEEITGDWIQSAMSDLRFR